MKTLIVGSGAREHTLLKACLDSPIVTSICATPGNGGMAQDAKCFSVPVDDIDGIVKLAVKESVDFVIVGPELPLSLGLIDRLKEKNILAYGPTQAASQLESSKVFAKDFLKKHKIPTAKSQSFTKSAEALTYLETHKLPVVIKASGLASGKGVFIAQTLEEAQTAVTEILDKHTFGSSGDEIIIEQFLEGTEASITVVVSGNDFVLLPPAQDHKRLGDNNTGPNTGGMGAFAPSTAVTSELNREIKDTIIRPTLQGIETDNLNFSGTLFIGIMLTELGPYVLEYNVRFGDPEIQTLFPLFDSDLIELLRDCAEGTLAETPVKFSSNHSTSIVHAVEGYPEKFPTGDTITVPETLPGCITVAHAGTKLKGETLTTNGGRVLTVTAIAKTHEDATENAYAASEQITFDHQYYRKDIGATQLTPA